MLTETINRLLNQTREALLAIEKAKNLTTIITILREAKVQEVILLHLEALVFLHLEVVQEVLQVAGALEEVEGNF